jgi:hypothetical protein
MSKKIDEYKMETNTYPKQKENWKSEKAFVEIQEATLKTGEKENLPRKEKKKKEMKKKMDKHLYREMWLIKNRNGRESQYVIREKGMGMRRK